MSLPRLQSWERPHEAVRLLLRGATLRSCGPVAVAVGSLLTAVNEGDVLLAGPPRRAVVLKLVGNLLVPYCTSSYGALLAVRRPRPAAGEPGR